MKGTGPQCREANHEVMTVVMKNCSKEKPSITANWSERCYYVDANLVDSVRPWRTLYWLWHACLRGGKMTWEPLVSLPEFAIDSFPGLSCFRAKFSSANLAPGRSSTPLRKLCCRVYCLDFLCKSPGQHQGISMGPSSP
jgi:hypothetical protein